MQNVHSNVQMTASLESGGKSLLQHSQLGLNSSIDFSLLIHNAASMRGFIVDDTQINLSRFLRSR